MHEAAKLDFASFAADEETVCLKHVFININRFCYVPTSIIFSTFSFFLYTWKLDSQYLPSLSPTRHFHFHCSTASLIKPKHLGFAVYDH